MQQSAASLDPTPEQLRGLVLDFLLHKGYHETARVLAETSSVVQLNADGDIVHAEESPVSDDALQNARLRREIKDCILAGEIEAATRLLNLHFPTVLAQGEESPKSKRGVAKSSKSAPSNSSYPYPSSSSPHTATRKLPKSQGFTHPTSLSPAHLRLNVQIQEFLELSRTIPLPHPNPAQRTRLSNDDRRDSGFQPQQQSLITSPTSPRSPDLSQDRINLRKLQLLKFARNLLSEASKLSSPVKEVYLKELNDVCIVMAHHQPEHFPHASKFLSMDRRADLAEQINSAILHHTAQSPQSNLEAICRQTTAVWGQLAEDEVPLPHPKDWPENVTPPPPMTLKKGASEMSQPFYLTAFLNKTR